MPTKEPHMHELDDVSTEEFVSSSCLTQNASKFQAYLELRAQCYGSRHAFSVSFRGLSHFEAREAVRGMPNPSDDAKASAIEDAPGFSAALKKRIGKIPVKGLWNEQAAVETLFSILDDPEATGADVQGAMAELDILRPEWRGDLAAVLRPRAHLGRALSPH